MSAAQRFPPEIWGEILRNVKPPASILALDSSSYLPEILEWRDELFTPELEKERLKDVASLRLVSREMRTVASSFFWSTVRIKTSAQGLSLAKLLEEEWDQRDKPCSAALNVKDLRIETNTWDVDAWTSAGYEDEPISALFGYLPNTVSLHLDSRSPAPSSALVSLSYLRRPIRVLSGLGVGIENIISVLTLLESVSASLTSLQLVQVGRVVPSKSPASHSARTVTLPHLQDLVIGTRHWNEQSYGEPLEDALEGVWSLPSLSRISLTSLTEILDEIRWGPEVLEFVRVNATLEQLRAIKPTSNMLNLCSDHQRVFGGSTVEELVISLSNTTSSDPFALPSMPVPSVKRIIILPFPTNGFFEPPKAEGNALVAYLSKELFPGLEEVIWIETTPNSTTVWKPWFDLSHRLLESGVKVTVL